MMARISPIAHGELIRRLRKFGFKGPVAGGKHLYMTRGQHRLTIPNRVGRLEQPHLRQVDEVRVAGVVSRHLEDCKPEYRDRIVVPVWEFPILEVRHRRVHPVPF